MTSLRPLKETDWIEFEISEQLNFLNTDPEDRPFASKYESRERMRRIRNDLLSYIEQRKQQYDDEEKVLVTAESALAALSYELAQNFYATEERPAAELCAKEALDRIDDRLISAAANDREETSAEDAFISARIGLLNTLGCIHCERADAESAISTLLRADKLYEDYMMMKKKEGTTTAPPWEMKRALRWSCGVLDQIHDPISTNPNDDPWNTFQRLRTYTMYYLAQAYKLNGQLGLAAGYCRQTLARQLKSGEYDRTEWSLNAATLSVYYLGKGSFRAARRCLAAASAVLDSLKDGVDDQQQEERQKRLDRTGADVDRCWARYGIELLEEAAKRLHHDEHKSAQDDQGGVSIDGDDAFSKYLPEIGKFEEEEGGGVVDEFFPTTFSTARPVFLRVQRRISSAQSAFYTLTDHATDHVELAQDSSRSYKALIAFEPEIDRKCKMHKRRIDCLTAVYERLNPDYYLSLRRQLSFELGEIYNDMMDLKIEAANNNNNEKQPPNAHQIAKINTLAVSGMKYFRDEFLNSFVGTAAEEESAEEEGGKKQYDPDHVRPVVLAHFYCARLHSKLLTGDMREKVANCQASLREYRWVVDYVDRVDPAAGLERVKDEYDISKDMVSLLPVKMDRMKQVMMR